MAGDKWAEIEAEFGRAQRAGSWWDEERVVQRAFRVDPRLGERLRARQLYAPATVQLEVAA